MKKFEYLTRRVLPWGQLNGNLNTLGDKGWELVTCEKISLEAVEVIGYNIVLKREITSPPADKKGD